MILQEKGPISPQNYRPIYEKADPATRGRFRAKRSYLKRVKNLSEEEAVSQALKVFNLNTTKVVQPILSSYEPTSEEISKVINEIKNSASVIPISSDSSQKDSITSQPEETRKKSPRTLQSFFNDFSKYSVIKLCLYALIVPITANAIYSAISFASLNSSFSTAISWILALITDFIALDHFSSAEDPKGKNEDLVSLGIAVLILAGNILGAYFLFKKEMKIEETFQTILKIEALETKLSNLKDQAAEAEAIYLAAKFPNASDPKSCEEGLSSTCGKIFKKASRSERISFLSKSAQVTRLEKDISKFKTQSPNKTVTGGAFWFHFSYYCGVWLLLFSVIRLEGIEKRRRRSL